MVAHMAVYRASLRENEWGQQICGEDLIVEIEEPKRKYDREHITKLGWVSRGREQNNT